MQTTRRAFTIIELVMVLVLTGIVLAIALPRIDVTKYRADAAVQGLRGLLQQAQRTALQRQYDIYILFDTARNEVTLGEDANNDTIIETSEHIRRQALLEGARFRVPPVGIDSAVHSSITASAFHTTNGLPSVVFHRDGAASANVDVYLYMPGRDGGQYRAIRVYRPTSRTTWYRFNGTSWVRAGM